MDPSTVRLFAYMAGFGLLTFAVYLVCMRMVRAEERRQAKRGR